VKRALEVHQDAFLAAEGLTFDDAGDHPDPDTVLAVEEPQPDRIAPQQTYEDIVRATRWCVLYGTSGFAVLCILIGAVESLFGR
jgi:hypothetical protein